MGNSALDENFLCIINREDIDGPAPVTAALVPKAGLAGEGVDQPGLAACQIAEPRYGVLRECLPCLRRVLSEQGPDLAPREVAKP